MAKGNKFTGGGVNQNKAAMMQRVQKMQEDMERMQAEISEKTVEATVGGGAVSSSGINTLNDKGVVSGAVKG